MIKISRVLLLIAIVCLFRSCECFGKKKHRGFGSNKITSPIFDKLGKHIEEDTAKRDAEFIATKMASFNQLLSSYHNLERIGGYIMSTFREDPKTPADTLTEEPNPSDDIKPFRFFLYPSEFNKFLTEQFFKDYSLDAEFIKEIVSMIDSDENGEISIDEIVDFLEIFFKKVIGILIDEQEKRENSPSSEDPQIKDDL